MSIESGNLGPDELLLGPRTMIPTSGNDRKAQEKFLAGNNASMKSSEPTVSLSYYPIWGVKVKDRRWDC